MTPTPTRRAALAMGLAATALPWPLAAQEDTTATQREVREMTMGAADAPVTVVEYASLTCPHCASFHTEVFGRIRQNYIEPGKVRFVVRDVYFDRLGLWAAMVARCEGGDRYFGIVKRLYERQAEWSRAASVEEALSGIFAIGRQAGLTDGQMRACVNDQAWAEALVAAYQRNMERDNIEGTPTFLIDGRKESNMSYDAFAEKLDAALSS